MSINSSGFSLPHSSTLSPICCWCCCYCYLLTSTFCFHLSHHISVHPCLTPLPLVVLQPLLLAIRWQLYRHHHCTATAREISRSPLTQRCWRPQRFCIIFAFESFFETMQEKQSAEQASRDPVSVDSVICGFPRCVGRKCIHYRYGGDTYIIILKVHNCVLWLVLWTVKFKLKISWLRQ